MLEKDEYDVDLVASIYKTVVRWQKQVHQVMDAISCGLQNINPFEV